MGKEGRRGRRERGSEEKKMAKESGNDREWTIDELRGPGCDITVLVCVHLSMMVLVLYPGSSPGFLYIMRLSVSCPYRQRGQLNEQEKVGGCNKFLRVGKPKFTLNLQQLKAVHHIYVRGERGFG